MYFSDFTRRPIEEGNPCGVIPNNLDDFDEIKRQINNISKVTGRVSWKKVQTLSKSILMKHSKDFRCSCYYTVAAAHNDGLKGFVEGLNSILDLCVVYWFNAYPEHSKKNARIGSLEWLVEHSEKRIKLFKVTNDDLPLIEAGHQICLRIEEEMRFHYGAKSPSLSAIRRIFRVWTDDLREQTTKKEQKEQEKKRVVQQVNVVKPKPSITVDVSPKKMSTPQQTETTNKVNINPHIWKLMLSASIVAALVLVHYAADYYETSSLRNRINEASVTQLAAISNELISATKQAKDTAQVPLITKLDELVLNWAARPESIVQIVELNQVSKNLLTLYPDSSPVKLLNQNLIKQKKTLEEEYLSLQRRFSNARTAIANVNTKNDSEDVALAYRYSNSLFPLLGRIEYAENNNELEEIDKSIQLLNVYLYKLTQLQNGVEQHVETIQ
ncbi:type VI secretion system ImpA family N-terminal domain-containing protein [Vibrio lamellibrachiae]|uniref:type VI secretion system ImpA family N-terminal domain-containing protein n=1 Tax=Vibrio lamellibrachiae TaxID=2910253 RepID=UPI003D143A15